MSARRVPILSVEEFLAVERSADTRHEYYAGESFAMAGGSYGHAVLIANLCGELRNELRGKPWRAVASELLFRAGSTAMLTYPDVMVFCGPVVFGDERQDVALNPIVVAEVLSPGTEGFDRGKKAAAYRGTASIEQYLLVSQEEAVVEVYTRDGQDWRMHEVRGLDGVCDLASIGVRVAMGVLYEGVGL